MLPLIGIGCIVGLHWMCFFGAIKLANISICLAGMATISFFTAFTEPLFDRRRIRPLEVALGLLVVLGIVLVAGFERGRIAGLSRRFVRRDAGRGVSGAQPHDSSTKAASIRW